VRKLLASIDGDPDERAVRLFEWLPAEHAARLLATPPGEALQEARRPLFDALEAVRDRPAVDRVLRLDQLFFLTDHNLNYTDKTGMASGVEIRVPYLDPDLVAWAATVPLRAKLRRGQTKWVLRKAMEPYLPREIIYRPKAGFGLPLRAWLQTTLRPMADELLDRRAIIGRGLFDPDSVEALRRDTASGRTDGSYALLGMIAIELWCRRFVDQPLQAAAA
jgi:asparagine synthase (glutamine-hydrolysing)